MPVCRSGVAILLAAMAGPAMAAVNATDSGVRDYVRGRHASALDHNAAASGYFAGALAQAPGDPVLTRRTFDLAVAAGDQAMATRLAETLARSDRFDTTVGLVRMNGAIQRKEWAAVDRIRTDLVSAGFAAFVLPIIDAWTRFGRGNAADALILLEPTGQEGFAKAYVVEHRAHLLTASGRWDEAATAYADMLAGDGARVTRIRLLAAGALQSAGKPAEATQMLAAGGSNQLIDAARTRLAAGLPVTEPVDTPRRGISQLYARLASDLAREKPLPISLVLARLSTFLAPESEDCWLAAADILFRSGQQDAALGALARIGPKSPLAGTARTLKAAVLQGIDRAAESLALLQAAAADKDARYDDFARLGEALSRAERFGEAATAFERSLALAPAESPDQWYLHFSAGSAYERAGDWRRGEAALRKALALAPGEAVVLNYLGYAMLDRGERLPEATQLIERAVAARPGDGYIIDSLGWAHYRSGRYQEAVVSLERAVAELPDDPAINEHLGDAYWQVGRRIEARFRWKASLDGGPEPDAQKRVLAKIDYGLNPPIAATRRK